MLCFLPEMSALYPYAVCLSGVLVQQGVGRMLLEAEKMWSFAHTICKLIPDRVPWGGIRQWGRWTSGSAMIEAVYRISRSFGKGRWAGRM